MICQYIVAQSFVTADHLQTYYLQSTQVPEKVLQDLQCDAEFSGDFRFRGLAAKSDLAVYNCVFDPSRFATEAARAPINCSEAVENRAANAERGVVTQLNVLVGIVFIHSFEEPENPSVHQVFQKYLGRHASVNTTCDAADLRELLDNDLLALDFVECD